MGTSVDPVGSVVEAAGQAVGSLAGQAGDEAAWDLELDAPQAAVAEDAGGWLRGFAFLTTVVVMGLTILFVLESLAVHNRPHYHTIGIILAGGVVVALLLVAGSAWRAFSQAGARVRLKLRRTPAAAASTDGSLAPMIVTELVKWMAPEASAGSAATPAPSTAPAITPPANAPAPPPQTTSQTTPTTADEVAPPKNPVAKEPVLIGSILLAAGTLAVGFAANLGAGELAAISAGASAIVGLLLRQQVTPLAAPKDAQNNPLSPSP